MPQIQYRDAKGATRVIELGDKELVIGRQPTCDIVLPREYVSRRHARILKKGADWIIEDIGSSHGTFVNRLRIKEKVLVPGDQILVGDELISFSTANAGMSRPKPVAPASAANEKPSLRPAGIIPGSPQPSSSTNPGLGIDETADNDVPEIVAERGVEAGQLMRTMIGARAVDVSVLGTNAKSGIAALVDAEPESAEDGPGGRDSLVASHLLTLVRISDELRRCTSVEAVATTAVSMAMRATRASRGVLARKDPKTGRFVAIAELTDEHDPRVPGGPVHVSRTFIDKVVAGKTAMIAQDTGADERVKAALSIAVLDIKSILCAPLWDGDDIHGYVYLDNTGGRRLFRPTDLDLINAIAHHAAAEIARLTLMERIREEENQRKYLSRFFAPDVIRHLEAERKAGKADPTASAQEAEITVLFADIQGFTRMSETMTPANVKKFLDEYLDKMTEILVDRHGGTLDKYIGDSIMVIFGFPFSHGLEADAKAAVAAAIEMRDTMEILRKTRAEFASVHIRIGINTGKVIAGTIGSQRRYEFTVLGDAVNVASRLESTADAGRIQIGERTFEAVQSTFDCTSAGERQVKNRTAPVKCWWVERVKKLPR